MKHCRNSSIVSSAGVGATGQERWMQRDFSALSRKLAKHSLPEAVSSGQHMAKVKIKGRKLMEKRDKNILRIWKIVPEQGNHTTHALKKI